MHLTMGNIGYIYMMANANDLVFIARIADQVRNDGGGVRNDGKGKVFVYCRGRCLQLKNSIEVPMREGGLSVPLLQLF